ncbi:MAG: aminotransferase class I/II-fold pyridoxal phosphate-dependent enzyme, partial [Deltaproteobacteria bacterium]|nr:aminotransferase class I/II-fold pyridoxal phosphate-dependent enzyme [Deltaproteobacteria bacterium]
YEYGGETDYNDIRYLRLNNSPNHLCVNEKIAALERGEAAIVTASGMAAITTALLHTVGAGEILLAQEGLYGGTHHFLSHEFAGFGREVRFFDAQDLSALSGLVDKKVKAIYVESTSNPLLRVPDLIAIAEFAKKNGLVSMVDNTFPSPINCTPLEMGFDLVLHSATKYLNGHTDITAGCAVGRKKVITGVTNLLNHLGGCLDPHACFLLNRGLKTLPIRVREQNATAFKLASALEGHKRLKRVIYPGLKSHPDFERAKRVLRGFGAMVSLDFDGSTAEADAFMGRLKLAFSAPSLGGVETLVTRPATTSHSGVKPEERVRMGLSDTLIRVSVGLEDSGDLIADFERALR